MKILVTISLLCLVFSASCKKDKGSGSQNQNTQKQVLQGTAIGNSGPVPNATVEIFPRVNADETALATTRTAQDGSFSVTVDSHPSHSGYRIVITSGSGDIRGVLARNQLVAIVATLKEIVRIDAISTKVALAIENIETIESVEELKEKIEQAVEALRVAVAEAIGADPANFQLGLEQDVLNALDEVAIVLDGPTDDGNRTDVNTDLDNCTEYSIVNKGTYDPQNPPSVRSSGSIEIGVYGGRLATAQGKINTTACEGFLHNESADKQTCDQYADGSTFGEFTSFPVGYEIRNDRGSEDPPAFFLVVEGEFPQQPGYLKFSVTDPDREVLVFQPSEAFSNITVARAFVDGLEFFDFGQNFELSTILDSNGKAVINMDARRVAIAVGLAEFRSFSLIFDPNPHPMPPDTAGPVTLTNKASLCFGSDQPPNFGHPVVGSSSNAPPPPPANSF